MPSPGRRDGQGRHNEELLTRRPPDRLRQGKDPIETPATVSEELARAFNTKDPLAREGLAVVPKDIAGAGFEPATFGL